MGGNLKCLGNVNKKSGLTGTWKKGKVCAAHCHYVVRKTVAYVSQASVCEYALSKSCLMGSHMWKEEYERKGELEFILHRRRRDGSGALLVFDYLHISVLHSSIGKSTVYVTHNVASH